MSTFFRGPVCGTDNCRSRLWRIIDGRRTCQYGHVMDGDVEFNDDEDNINSMGVVTRRLNLTTNATGSFRASSQSQTLGQSNPAEFTKTYGPEGDRLFLKCFQHVLRLQCGWLVQHEHFPPVFPHVVKLLWARLLPAVHNDDNHAGTGVPTATRTRPPGRYRLSLLSSVCLLHMAGTHLRLPVFWFDYLRWMCNLQLPYFKAGLHLPAVWRRQLPNYYLQLLEGGKVPAEGQFYHKLARTCRAVQPPSFFSRAVALEPLLLKLLLALRLPPQPLFFHVLDLVQRIRQNTSAEPFPGDELPERDLLHLQPELGAVACLIVTLRFRLLQGEDKFLTRYCAGWLLANAGDLVTQLSSTTSTSTASLAATDQYLEWLETRFLPASTRGGGGGGDESTEPGSQPRSIDQRIADRKLHALFPLERVGVSSAAPAPAPAPAPASTSDVRDAYRAICQDAAAANVAGDAEELASRVETQLVIWTCPLLAITEAQMRRCIEHAYRCAGPA
ncbi:LANO_0E13916g1_1 [Lachancea nothofagi CBS 11611]|uniref:LANO_0E13916g1_1 n=1 Tax=Lachancea nothofagi CBS 11611 TaxID=1266666 RepID=A0A1G4JZH0_9SACH|nr:LANO_0E13916g1_1 [Lachancea nothofagi CBS 11611]